jgi:hypothetical protein
LRRRRLKKSIAEIRYADGIRMHRINASGFLNARVVIVNKMTVTAGSMVIADGICIER